MGRVMYVFPQYKESDLLGMRVSRFRWLESEAIYWRRARVIDQARAAILAQVRDQEREKMLHAYRIGDFWGEDH